MPALHSTHTEDNPMSENPRKDELKESAAPTAPSPDERVKDLPVGADEEEQKKVKGGAINGGTSGRKLSQ
jgi:hypothetical protein